MDIDIDIDPVYSPALIQHFKHYSNLLYSSLEPEFPKGNLPKGSIKALSIQ